MMKVLYIVSTLKRAGPTNQLYYLVKNLDRHIFQPHILTLSPEPEDSERANFEALGVSVESLNLSRFKGLFFAKRKVEAVVAKLSPDLIHTQGVRADAISASLQHQVPRICTIRNFPQIDYRLTYGRMLGKILTWCHAKALSKMSICCCVSDSVAVNLDRFSEIGNRLVVLNGVDNEKFYSPSEALKQKIRFRLLLPENALVWIASIGKDKRKNSTVIVRQFLRFAEGKSNYFLIFIGDGQLRKACQVLSAESSQVRFYGRTKDVKLFLQAADFFVSASLAEGFPNAVLEAMACGLPVLLSDIPPHAELKRLCKKGVLLFSIAEDSSLVSAFAESLAQPYPELASAVSAAVSDRLAATKMSRAYQSVYLKACEASE